MVDAITNAGERAVGLTHQLLAFSRKQVVQMQILDLNQVIKQAIPLLQRMIGEDVTLVTALSPDLWPIKADAGQVEQILMNLAVNGRHAMPLGGTLSLRTENIPARPGDAPTVATQDQVRLVVKDNGQGIPEDIQPLIFEPFFTTKEPGRGTGLGLATVKSIVRQWSGRITVASKVGEGAAFSIEFPRTQEKAQAQTDTRKGPPPQGRETVLVVDDDEMIRAVIRLALQERGYKVLEARNPTEALEIFQKEGATIHLLVTDIIMPVMSGHKLAERILQLWPGKKVLYLSGYVSADTARFSPGQSAAFLRKPFGIPELLWKVREVLDPS